MSAPSPTVTRDGDLITVTLPTLNRMTAITLARKAAGGMVANTGQPPTRKGRGYVFTYSAVSREAKPAVAPDVRAAVGKRQTELANPPKAAKAPKAPKAADTGEDRMAYLERMVLELSAQLAGATPAKAPKAAKAAKAPERPAYVPSPDQARRKVHTCPTCQDLGVVRGSGSRKGQPYVTANGAAQATNAVTCPACKGKSKRAA